MACPLQTHPSVYADDCRRLFGHVIPHIPCKRSDAPPPGDPDSGQARDQNGTAPVLVVMNGVELCNYVKL